MHTPMTSSTTIRSGLGIFALGLISVAVLNACGGGDAVKAPASTTAAATTFVTSSSLATPTAQVAAGTVRYMIQGLLSPSAVSVEGTATFAASNFDANNAVITIGNNSLANTDGTHAVQEFMGDATFAQGRWTKGLATTNINGVVSSTTLTGTDTSALHYLITHDMTMFPSHGTYKCGTNVRSTGLTYSGGTTISNPMLVGALVPDATITIDGSGATLSVNSLTVYAGNTVSYEPAGTVPFANPGVGPAYTDNYQSGGEGIAYVLGEGTATNEITLGIALRRKMSNDTLYKGMTSVICKP